ncbi:hypothetical protein ACHAWO_012161 [Cyclotella atomus]|uniref:RanBP2-type domain-containing protein n=1 Tax=Cyclotella atomus TaxID=382360 RepID=A0ABD3NKF1_9STRA
MSWACIRCTFPNKVGSALCEMCEAARPRIRNTASAAAEHAEAPGAEAPSAAQEETVAAPEAIGHREEHTDENQDENSGHWDAFASLQENCESSDESESSQDSCSEDDEGNNDESRQWNAFESLENNYQSSSSESESESEEDGSEPGTTQQECIELLSSSDEEHNHSQHDNQSSYQRDLLDSDEDQEPAPKRRRITKISDHFKAKDDKKPSKSKPRKSKEDSLIVLDDSSISEDESPSFRGRERAIPSWQRSVPLHSTTILPVQQTRLNTSQSRKSIPRGNTLPSASFSCMNGRNDVLGGGGSGVNGVSLQAQHDESGSNKKRKARAAPAKAKSSRKSTTKKPSTKKRASKKSTTATEDENDKPKARKRKSYKRRGKRSSSASTSRSRSMGANGRSTNNAWSARERGIRNNRNNSSGPSTYMSIRKQESALSGIGGATMSF